jgi:transposase InsO family protein
MIPVEDRKAIVAHLDEARAAGARLAPACDLIGVDPRTVQRWRRADGLELGDRRPHADRSKPAHALSDAERDEVLEVANSDRFADVPPTRIVPELADEGRYIASESTFYRVLRDADQVRHRGRTKAPERRKPPSTHTATAPNELWTWDMTYLPASVVGRWFYLYLILDVFSRKIVGFEVHDTDASEHAAHLLKRTALAEGIAAKAHRPVLHGDNGATLKGTTVLAMMHWLGVKPSYSRPRVSNDNAFVESLFRTAKYRPEYPTSPFASLDEARAWASRFVHWYNHQHLHSGIRYVTPAQRHAGHDAEILDRRHRTYEAARAANPGRWSGRTRNWSVIGTVTLNPERADAGAASEPKTISRATA